MKTLLIVVCVGGVALIFALGAVAYLQAKWRDR